MVHRFPTIHDKPNKTNPSGLRFPRNSLINQEEKPKTKRSKSRIKLTGRRAEEGVLTAKVRL
jgi:hypothetical protein